MMTLLHLQTPRTIISQSRAKMTKLTKMRAWLNDLSEAAFGTPSGTPEHSKLLLANTDVCVQVQIDASLFGKAAISDSATRSYSTHPYQTLKSEIAISTRITNFL